MKKWLIVSVFTVSLLSLTGIGVIGAERYTNQLVLNEVEVYLTEQYPTLNYAIGEIDDTSDFGFYGYFKYEVEVINTDTSERFYVYYDQHIDRIEDSIQLAEIEQHLENVIAPQVQAYAIEHYGDIRYTDVSYYFETGAPLILIKCNESSVLITQKQFDEFVHFLQDELNVQHATVIVDYWMGENGYQTDY